MDGYLKKLDIEQKYVSMQKLFDKQITLNRELINITQEMESLPEIPSNIDDWISSIPKSDSNKNFTLADFNRMFQMNKKYNSILDERNDNAQKIKILAIDNLLDRIKDILEK